MNGCIQTELGGGIFHSGPTIFTYGPLESGSRVCVGTLGGWVHPFLDFELLGQLDTLGQGANPRVDAKALGLQLLALLPQVLQGYVEDLDELVLFQLGLEVLVLRQAHIDGYVDHPEVSITEPGVYIFWFPATGLVSVKACPAEGLQRRCRATNDGIASWVTDRST